MSGRISGTSGTRPTCGCERSRAAIKDDEHDPFNAPEVAHPRARERSGWRPSHRPSESSAQISSRVSAGGIPAEPEELPGSYVVFDVPELPRSVVHVIDPA